MAETLLHWLSNVPGPLAVLLAAMVPIGELRAAIPLGMLTFRLPWYEAFFLAVVGNIVPVLPLLIGLKYAARVLTSFPNPLGRFLTWRENGLRTRHGHRFQKYGAWALLPFVAIPFPLTGAWTGCLAAWVFQVPTRKALPIIGAGVLIAGGIVTLVVALGVSMPFLRTNS